MPVDPDELADPATLAEPAEADDTIRLSAAEANVLLRAAEHLAEEIANGHHYWGWSAYDAANNADRLNEARRRVDDRLGDAAEGLLP